MTTTTTSVTRSTSLIKKYLKEKYGITKSSVKSSFYSMGSSLRISYELGPDAKVVEAEFNRLQYGQFDGMTDSYNFAKDDETGMILDGQRLKEYKYVFISQEFPDNFWFELAKFFTSKVNYADCHQVETMDDFRLHFSTNVGGAWNWSELIRQFIRTRNFITQDYSKIKFIEIKDGELCWEKQLIYEVDGVQYTTQTYEVKKSTIKKASRPEVNGVKVIEYSEKSIAVIGQTYEIRERLSEIGGAFNYYLKVDGKTVKGWIFPKTKESQVNEVVFEYALVEN